MRYAAVRIGLVTLAVSTAPLVGQAPHAAPGSVRVGVGLGTTVPSGYASNLPDQMGYRAQLFAACGITTCLHPSARSPACHAIAGVPVLGDRRGI